MLIAIPSKGRPSKVKSLKVLPSATVYVPANEGEAYRRANPETAIVEVPQAACGITATRNWILDATDDPWVVFVDDDLKSAGWIELGETAGRHVTVPSEAAWMDEFARAFALLEDVGLRIWGFDTAGARRSVYPYRPIVWHTYVTASCMGILNDGRTRFDPSFPIKEDYELCLRCLKEDGAVLGIRWVYWVNEHWTGAGGCKDYRSQEMERAAITRLIKMYPGMIRRVTRGGSTYAIELEF
jgi:hypothetical protein